MSPNASSFSISSFMKQFALLSTLALVLLGQLSTSAAAAPVIAEEDAQAEKLINALLSGVGKEEIEKLLNEGLNINSRIKPGLTVYQAAVLRGDLEVASFLAEHGAITNAPMPPRDTLVDALFSRVITNNGAGAAVLVAQNGKVLFQKGYGL